MAYGVVTLGRIFGGVVGGAGGALQRGGQYGLAGVAVGGAIGATGGAIGGAPVPPAEALTVPGGALLGGAVGGAGGFLYGAGTGMVEGVPGGMATGGELGQRLSDWLFGADKQAAAAPNVDTRPNCVGCSSTTMENRAAPPEKKKGERPPNMAPEGATRDEALDKAKEDHNIPSDEEPEVTPNEVDGKNRKGSEDLTYLDRDGNIVKFRHDYDGHQYPDDPDQDRGPHINYDIPGTNRSDHYDYGGDGKPFGPLRR